MLVCSVVFLTIAFILLGGYMIFFKPIEVLTANIALTSCYVIYASVLIMLPFAWKKMQGNMNNKP